MTNQHRCFVPLRPRRRHTNPQRKHAGKKEFIWSRCPWVSCHVVSLFHDVHALVSSMCHRCIIGFKVRCAPDWLSGRSITHSNTTSKPCAFLHAATMTPSCIAFDLKSASPAGSQIYPTFQFSHGIPHCSCSCSSPGLMVHSDRLSGLLKVHCRGHHFQCHAWNTADRQVTSSSSSLRQTWSWEQRAWKQQRDWAKRTEWII